MTFSDLQLDALLLASINRSGYTSPTPIQQAAMPVALAGRDLVGTAQTGTGKTAAFVLPMLQRLLSGTHNRVRGLIVTPTRELAIQIDDTIKTLSKGTGIRSITIFGGVNANPQIKAVKAGAEILVACPGRLLDLIAQKHIVLNNLEILILDEADRMFDMGFLPDIKRILKQLPQKRQTMLFSATFPKEIEALAQQALTKPKRITVGISRPAHTVVHAVYPVLPHLKTALLLRLLKETDTGSVLIFTRTKHRATRLSRRIEREKYAATSLHGDRSQSQRQAALTGFKSGKFQIMVATDIAARGLDVENISHVINFDIPDTEDAYIHRIGRTGRACRTGDAFTFITPDDAGMVRSLEKIMGESIPRKTIADFDYNAAAPPRQPQRARQPRSATQRSQQQQKGHKKASSRTAQRPHTSKKTTGQKQNTNGAPAVSKKRPTHKSHQKIDYI